MSTLTTTIQHNFGSFGHSNQRRKRNKRNPDWKRRNKMLIVCRCLYIENPKDSTRKLLELINEYSKVAGYKINTQKSLAFLCTNNEKTEREIKETFPFTIATQRIRSDQISGSVVSDSLRPHESQHARPPCPSPTPGVHSDSCPSSQ